ncbi:IQ domain-containing protein M [Pteronotus mesoamericanus]|uniref:IQ domain-containing protein M n=1 Tax=Pteronotus mesoamericanus TaxID=1884717 RepID=UPI0023EBF8C3|nr:IQ domain-containing protein M [Pteronotus parnellii mesoamericanus]
MPKMKHVDHNVSANTLRKPLFVWVWGHFHEVHRQEKKPVGEHRRASPVVEVKIPSPHPDGMVAFHSGQPASQLRWIFLQEGWNWRISNFLLLPSSRHAYDAMLDLLSFISPTWKETSEEVTDMEMNAYREEAQTRTKSEKGLIQDERVHAGEILIPGRTSWADDRGSLWQHLGELGSTAGSKQAIGVARVCVSSSTVHGEQAALGIGGNLKHRPRAQLERRGPVLEITKQDLFQEAKNLIAQHYEKINESKVQGRSVNVFRNKHQKPKSGIFIPFEIKKKETLDVVQELQRIYKCICFPKDVSKGGHFEEPPQQTPFKEPRRFNVKEKFKGPRDLIAKEQVTLCKIVTNIESVGKKMEKEKQQQREKPRVLDSSAFPVSRFGLPLQPMTSPLAGLLKEHDKAFCNWRGTVSMRSSRGTHDSSLPSFSGSSFPEYSAKTFMKKEQLAIKPEPEPQPRVQPIPSKIDKLDNKVKRIGPHIEIFQVFQKRDKLIITKKVIRMIIIMQAHIRGWLERKRYQRIMTKALYHGPNLRAAINMYCRLIHRVKYRLGLWRTRQIINFAELEEWMDRKKFYETMFAKKEDWQGLERSELLKYFNDCGHFPTQQQIDQVWDLVHREDREKYSELIKKSNAIEMLFTLYPPQGAHVKNNMRLRSTWLRPIVNGEEGYKYIVTGHPVIKRANIRIVGKLVSTSMRERKMRQHHFF